LGWAEVIESRVAALVEREAGLDVDGGPRK
jgi:hypothetical protein